MNNIIFLKIPDKCPVCGAPTEIRESDSGIRSLFCSNDDCPRRLINKLEHFCGKSGLDIKGLSEATLEKCINWGWLNSFKDIFTLQDHYKEWLNKPGFGFASVNNILTAIEAVQMNCDLARFIAAIGIPQIGLNSAKDLVKVFPTWDEFRAAVDNKKYSFEKIDGIGPEINYNLKHFDYTEADFLGKIVKWQINKIEETTSSPFSGKTFVITGSVKQFKNRAELSEKITSLGGKVTGSVSKNTNYLINNDNTSSSSKNLSAKKLNVPIITEEEFLKLLTK